MIHQVVVDLRTAGSGQQFTSQEQETEYHQRLAAARAAIAPGVRFVVAPGQRVQLRDGTWLEAGAPIAATDVSDEPGAPDKGRLAWRVFDDLVARERVLESYTWRPPADAQQHSG